MVIYHAYCETSGKSYIGQTSRALSLRWYDHVYQTPRLKDHFHNAIRKYGAGNFRLQVLAEANSDKKLDQLETLWILALNTKSPNGYNLTYGGGGVRGWKSTPMSNEKISLSKIGRPRPIGTLDRSWETRKSDPVAMEVFRNKCRENRLQGKPPKPIKVPKRSPSTIQKLKDAWIRRKERMKEVSSSS